MTAIETITVQALTLADLEAAIASFKIACRPARRGRPSKLGRRVFTYRGQEFTGWVGESCTGAGGWGMTFRLLDAEGRRVTIREIAKRTAA
jgi:hypothetical protein